MHYQCVMKKGTLREERMWGCYGADEELAKVLLQVSSHYKQLTTHLQPFISSIIIHYKYAMKMLTKHHCISAMAKSEVQQMRCNQTSLVALLTASQIKSSRSVCGHLTSRMTVKAVCLSICHWPAVPCDHMGLLQWSLQASTVQAVHLRGQTHRPSNWST